MFKHSDTGGNGLTGGSSLLLISSGTGGVAWTSLPRTKSAALNGLTIDDKQSCDLRQQSSHAMGIHGWGI